MGYALTDGTVGVHFNDSTSILLSPDKEYAAPLLHGSLYLTSICRGVDYIGSRSATDSPERTYCTLRSYGEGMKGKILLLKHFERYIMDKLYGDYDFTFEDVDRTRGMDYVQRYFRMKHVNVFVLSSGVLQVRIRPPFVFASDALY